MGLNAIISAHKDPIHHRSISSMSIQYSTHSLLAFLSTSNYPFTPFTVIAYFHLHTRPNMSLSGQGKRVDYSGNKD